MFDVAFRRVRGVTGKETREMRSGAREVQETRRGQADREKDEEHGARPELEVVHARQIRFHAEGQGEVKTPSANANSRWIAGSRECRVSESETCRPSCSSSS